MLRTLASGSAIVHGTWSLIVTLHHGDLGGWAWAAVQTCGPGVIGLAAVVAAMMFTPLPAVLSFEDV